MPPTVVRARFRNRRRAFAAWRAAAERRSVRSALSSIGRQGFGVAPRLASQLRRTGVWFEPATFGRDFRRAGRYRLYGVPDVRVAVIHGLGILYRSPWWTASGPTLLGVTQLELLPSVVPVSPPADETLQAGFELEIVIPKVVLKRRPPRIRIGEIKGIRSYAAGVDQLSRRGLTRGKDALVVYDDVGNVHMQVFKTDKKGVRQTVWDGWLGKVRKLPAHPVGSPGFGNVMEGKIRRMVAARTRQRFKRHKPNARGPDLVARELGWL